jgi:hypothetical protein
MCGAIPPLPQYAFMAPCSVKKSTETTLPLSLHLLASPVTIGTEFRDLEPCE